QLTFSPDW
uniref:Adipokinetic hormone n=2 Tax=Calyptratae TaxID=43742 RepID=AKH_DELRA|nr:RecName: Full=Adipokinetic hormone; Short=AKH; AltName: Full=Hypertrehalosaemic hormone; Short=HRTH [Delia radicum]P61856.1 RecName: Full=Adipokinetic hormone; Short=AKH; AltName: Full=Hypertrehalosaemic hormone; Short=HRTH [Protophormia terraenovae]